MPTGFAVEVLRQVAAPGGVHADYAQGERYTVFSSTMPNRLSITTTLGIATPRSGPTDLTGEPLGLGVVALDSDAVYLATVPTNRLERHFGNPPRFMSASPAFPQEIVAVSGPDEWFEFTTAFTDTDGDCVPDTRIPVTRAAINDVVVALETSPGSTTVRSYIAGNLGGTPRERALTGDAMALETVRIGDLLFALALTAAADGSQVTVMRPDATTITQEFQRDLPAGAEGLDMAVGLPECGSDLPPGCPPDPMTCSGFLHVVVHLP